MLDKIKRLEKRVKDLEKEVVLHETKRRKASPEDAFVHGERRIGAEKELQKVRAQLILANAEKQSKNKNIQNEIDELQRKKEDLARRWVQSGDSDVKLKLDKEISALNKQIDKLERKKR